MKRALLFVFLMGTLSATTALAGGPALPVATATGIVDKADSEAITIRPRGQDGKFAKHLTLKLTGTSKISSVTEEKRAGKLVFVQRELAAKDLEANQTIAVIYGTRGKDLVLLSAVVSAGR